MLEKTAKAKIRTLLFATVLGSSCAILSPAQAPLAAAHTQATLSTNEIVQRLMAANARRAEQLRGYRGKRLYKLDYYGMFGGHAEVVVEATYRAPNEKDFRVISQTGSRLLLRQVLSKLMQSEHDAQEEKNRRLLEINTTNYEFTSEGLQHTDGGDFYVFDLNPRSKSKFVYNGKIWVDAKDFAIARMEGTPATNPSLWVKHVDIQYQWVKVDGFWLPIHNHSVTDVRFGGRAVLDISYSDYVVNRTSQASTVSGRNSSLPDPSSISVDPHMP